MAPDPADPEHPEHPAGVKWTWQRGILLTLKVWPVIAGQKFSAIEICHRSDLRGVSAKLVGPKMTAVNGATVA
jgi:hypothetical protein